MSLAPYAAMFALLIAVLIGVLIYIMNLRRKIDEMHGMMVGMTFGMIAGLVTATVYLIPTGNFLVGVILGSVIGLAFGAPLGKLGNHLGIMEGVVAGPMGGMMGAMLGQMVRPFSINVFMPFFTVIFLLTMISISYTVHCGACCCGVKSRRKPSLKVSSRFVITWAIASVIMLITSIALPFSVEATNNSKSQPSTSQGLKLPASLQNIVQEEKQETAVRNNRQEITIRITSSKYSPNVILAKKKMPMTITLVADENAGCTREVVFPELNIRKIVAAGGSDTFTIPSLEPGTYNFRCSMDMARGKIVVS